MGAHAHPVAGLHQGHPSSVIQRHKFMTLLGLIAAGMLGLPQSS